MTVLNFTPSPVAADEGVINCIRNNATCEIDNNNFVSDYQYNLLTWFASQQAEIEHEKELQDRYDNSDKTAYACNFEDFLNMQTTPKIELWGPILHSQECMMIYAKRGIGKTLFTLQLAITLAGGGSFLKYDCNNPCKVLYIDGEMPICAMQERVSLAAKHLTHDSIERIHSNFRLITPDLQRQGIPVISSLAGQQWLKDEVEKADVIIFDSLLTLNPQNNDNDIASFIDMNRYLIALRGLGKSVILIHHAGKNGDQLGSVNKETLVDTVIKLSSNKKDDDGFDKINLEFTKHRNFYGEDTKPLIIKYSGKWEFCDSESDDLEERIVELSISNMTQSEIAQELGISQSTVSRVLSKFKKP